MDKLSLLRALNERLPSVAEQVISHWGTAELDAYVHRVLREAPTSGLGISDEIRQWLTSLVALHVQEFPKFAALSCEAVSARLSAHPDFRTVNERFPHIGAQIIAHWGRKGYHAYIESLFNDTRRLKRQGFPEAVVLALFHLTELHDKEHPEAAGRSGDIWASHDEHGLRLL